MKPKKLPKKRYKAKDDNAFKYNNEIVGISFLSLGVLLLLSFYFRNSIGMFGDFMRNLLLGLMGITAFLIPPLIILYSFLTILKKGGNNLHTRAFYTFILLNLLSSLIQAGHYDPKIYENMSFANSIVRFYDEGKALIGGGVFGGLISIPFLNTFKTLGTIIIITTLSIVDLILLTNISVVVFAASVRRKISGLFNRSIHEGEIDDNNPEQPEIKINISGEEKKEKVKPKSKVIDLTTERISRVPKEKDSIAADKKTLETKAAGVKNAVEKTEEIEPVQFIMKDLKKAKADDVNKIREELNKEIADHHKPGVEYKFPPFDLLNESTVGDSQDIKNLKNAAIEGARKLEDTLKSFGVEAKVTNVSRGPAVTRYEIQPSPGVKVSKIVNLSDDISLNLAASGVRIEAPIPGKAAVGIEVPNKEVTPVMLRDVIETQDFIQYSSKLAFSVGKDISGENVVADIGKMPHMLVAGATGSGKSVCINSLIISLLYKASPDEVKLLMVDPKVVELGIYNGIPHLLIPVVTDPKKAAGALNWAVQEMVNRYKLFAEKGVRDIKGYNAMLKEAGEQGSLPQIVIIIDELADLMMVAPNDVEDAICRLAQMARAAGMHLVIATQRPSVDVITGVIKANIPSRISFAVSSQVDSRTILDMAGAEKLLGKGDMLFYPIGEPKPIRVKGAFVSDKEVEKVVEFIKSQGKADYDATIIEEINSEKQTEESDPGDRDEYLEQAIDLVVEAGQASVSMIQRRFKVGYARAARIIDQMELRSIVGPFEGSKPRQVLITRQQWQELRMADGK